MPGRTFGRLTVLSAAERRPGGPARWLCACDCGSPPRAYGGQNLTKGRTKSCGCLKADKMRERLAALRAAAPAAEERPCASGLTVGTVRSRLARGWSLERALTEVPLPTEERWRALQGRAAETAEA
jgi:hypothetical protein